MSINVTIDGNSAHICRARMISDVDQIKKNERDRRRRLRLEQVRQQSKEISNRLLERAKKIAREELNKLERDGSEFKQLHDRKILEIQQKYQEELDDIGQAHISAALQSDVNEIIEKGKKMDRVMALKRGKDAIERMKEANQKDIAEAIHQKKLCEVREMENMRAAIIAKLSTSVSPGKKNKMETNPSPDIVSEESNNETLTPNRKSKILKKSLRKAKKFNSKEHKKTLSLKPGFLESKKHVLQPSLQKEMHKANRTEHLTDNVTDNLPREIIPTISTTPTKADKIARYNPEDYTQDMSDSTSNVSSSSSNLLSDDSSYFSDPAEQNKSVKSLLVDSKVQLYDCNLRQKNSYHRPLGIVQRIDIGDEPNAVEAAREMKDMERKRHVCKTHILSAKRQGEDAILREKVRRDYQALIRNLDYLTQEERKLKASQIPSNEEENTHMLLHQRNNCHEERQKRMNRATRKILDTYCTPAEYSHLTKRTVASLPRRNKCITSCDVPYFTWQEALPFVEEQAEVCRTDCRQDKNNEVSREEQILDMLKKIERQKRLLLQEFGTSLPDDVFNASIKSLFKDRPRQTKIPQVASAIRPLSPEIQVINMSNEEPKKEHKMKKADKPSTKKIEIAVQTEVDKTDRAENKSIQVELSQKSPKDSSKESTDIPHFVHSNDISARASHPIEPKVTIITPEMDDSNSNDSTSSENGMIIEIDKKEVIVTPKKRRIGVKASKRPAPRIYQKIRSKSVSSKATSPIKRFSRSYSGSRLPSPQKKTKCADTTDVASRKIDVHVSKSSFNDETDLSQEMRVSVDASAESSQTISGTNDQDRTIESKQFDKPYWIRTQTKKWVRIKDTSDTTTSTSYASPPPIQPKSVFEALSNVTPILEMLDTPGAEELRRLQHDISPVSTPETPSPRTMMMPSNIPHRHRISRMLRYSTESETNGSSVLSSTRIDQATLTEPSNIRQQECVAPSEYPLPLEQPSAKVCTCKNPACKLLHIKFDEIHEYALKTCPEILQKYEDLQNLCTERIASLTDLIEKVRNEQRGMDLSLIIPSNETSLMQLSTSIPAQTDEQAVHRLIESIETVHAQLAKTLVESQKFIGSKSLSEEKSVQDEGIQATLTSTPRSKLIDSGIADVQKRERKVAEGTAKPKITSDEKVNINFNRFQMQQKSEATSVTKVAERNFWPPCTHISFREEEVIELKELLQ